MSDSIVSEPLVFVQRSGKRVGRQFPAVPAICQQCGEEFAAIKASVDRGYGKFCSLRCSGKAKCRRGPLTKTATPPSTKKQRADASGALNYAIVKGEIVRPDRCDRCGKECRPDAHHDDYSKPMEVRWFCRSCHMKHHVELARKVS